MRHQRPFLFPLILLGLSVCSYAQLWSGILNSVGTGSCTGSSPTACAINWSNVGISGGIPSASWTQSGSTITSTGSNQVSAIQTALNSCGTNHFVLLAAGTFTINGNLSIPSNCALRGQGANSTILKVSTTSGPPIEIGTASPNFSNAVSITSGATAGSTSIVVSSASGISTGSYLVISNLNDGVIVSQNGSEGPCTWCDGNETSNGSRTQGQIVEVENVSGSTITISPGLYTTYSLTPHATPMSMTKYAGVENLQVYANNTHTSGNYTNFVMSGCAYCWLSGVEGNYTDGDQVDVYWSYFGEIVNSYFSNAFIHQAGAYDSDVDLINKTSGFLVQNNIVERLHVGFMMEWGAAGNVIAYNYSSAHFDSTTPNYVVQDVDFHGAHPQFNLIEGNVADTFGQDGIWGSSANNTFFRNWAVGTTTGCLPLTGRGTVVCTPLGVYGNAGVNGWWEFQGSKAISSDFDESSINFVGGVHGSAFQQSLQAYGSPQASTDRVVAMCGPVTCGTNSRPYDANNYGMSFGYGVTSDTGGTGSVNQGCSVSDGYTCESLTPYNTLFLHGEYSNISGSTTWSGSVSHTLPTSLYLNTEPSWWTSTIPWPAIGPDVTGGSGPGGHVYSTTAANPAQNCYFNVMGGSIGGAGSPYNFNAGTCYPSGQAPAPPTNLTVVVS